ncbi:hypothetical protein DB347_14635 [Opitutaceae bacterium EW11]|nr:hypothetical protein DB347_14635 [Opitutaceae bacterium EW11]
MELRHLRYFSAVAEALHFSRAAERLHLTQPALSRQIHDLEEELGTRLFNRHGTVTNLTPAGRQFLDDARQVLAAADCAVERIRSLRDRLRLGHYGGLWLQRYAPALQAFARAFPSNLLEPVELAPADMPAALRRGEIDLALIGAAPARLGPGFRMEEIETVPGMIAFRAGHPLAKKRVLSLSSLSECRWVGWDEHDFPGRNDVLREAAADAGFAPRFVHHADSAASMLARIGSSDEVACVLPFTHKLPHVGIAFARLRPPPVNYPMNALWLPKADRSGRAAKFAELLARHKPVG